MPWDKSFDVELALEKAMNAFWMRGYEATSLQDLVNCTGVNRASLYATYGDKHELFLSALRHYDTKMRRNLLESLEAKYGPRDAIRQVFLTFLGGMSDGRSNKGCFVTNTALELAPHDPEVGELVAHTQREIESFFLRMVKKGKASGEVTSSSKPTDISRGLLASLIGLVVLVRSRPDMALLNSIIHEAMRRLD